MKRGLKAAATHPVPLLTLPSQAELWLCVLAPVQGLERVTVLVWPQACMLDVIIRASFFYSPYPHLWVLSPHPTPGLAASKAGGTARLWRGSRPGEQLCGLEAAHSSWGGGREAALVVEGLLHWLPAQSHPALLTKAQKMGWHRRCLLKKTTQAPTLRGETHDVRNLWKIKDMMFYFGLHVRALLY